MSQNIATPLLADNRLAMPSFEKVAGPVTALAAGAALTHPAVRGAIAAAPGAINRAIGTATGMVKNAPQALANSSMQASADRAAAAGRQTVAPLTPAAAAAKAQERYQTPPAPAPGAKEAPAAPAGPAMGEPGGLHHAATNLTVGRGIGLGASLGALKGLADPGTTYDENGQPHQKSRIMSAISGATTGAAMGGLAAPLIRGGARAGIGAPKPGAGAPAAAAHETPPMPGGPTEPEPEPAPAAAPAAAPLKSLLPDISHLAPPAAMAGALPPVSAPGSGNRMSPGGRPLPPVGPPGTPGVARRSTDIVPEFKGSSFLPKVGLPSKVAFLPGGGAAMLNPATKGPANANPMTATSNEKMSMKKVANIIGDLKVIGSAVRSGMSKGPEDAKLEKKVHEKRVEMTHMNEGPAPKLEHTHMSPGSTIAPSMKAPANASPKFPALHLKK